ncbi:hypothetical protein NPJ82_02595 [Sphingomonas sp. NY01]|uniref:hypothetical protein n=1 Tax=Sphingomonas sp. NY01 TaxID=2968057 RepID=UPI00315CB007
MRTTLGDLLADISVEKERILSLDGGEEQQVAAADLLRKSMFFIHKLLGVEVLQAALGSVDENDPEAVLKVAAARISIFAGLFYQIPEDAASPMKVVEEAAAISNGDAPQMFAKFSDTKVKDRVIRAKFRAHVWAAYLKASGMPAMQAERRVEDAFGYPWETIRKGWTRDVGAALDEVYRSFALNLAKVTGAAGRPNWEQAEIAHQRTIDTHATNDMLDWEIALRLDGQRFIRALNANAKRR